MDSYGDYELNTTYWLWATNGTNKQLWKSLDLSEVTDKFKVTLNVHQWDSTPWVSRNFGFLGYGSYIYLWYTIWFDQVSIQSGATSHSFNLATVLPNTTLSKLDILYDFNSQDTTITLYWADWTNYRYIWSNESSSTLLEMVQDISSVALEPWKTWLKDITLDW
jgi:hypothetical protein